MAGLSSSQLLFVTITYMLLRCGYGCGYGSLRTVKLVYQPYGPRMCRVLCKLSPDSLFFVLEDLSCNRIEATNVSSYLPAFTAAEATLIKSECPVSETKWDICSAERKGSDLDMKKDAACSRDLQLIQHNRDITLHRACEEGRLAVVKYILSHGIADINCRGKLGRTPVMAAVRTGQASVFDYLVRRGCNLSAVDDNHDNVLHVACKVGDADLVRKLVVVEKIDIESRGKYGHTPVLTTVYHCHRKVFDFLVNKSCNRKVVGEDGSNVLHVACGVCDFDVVKYIVSRNIIDIESKNNYDYTPLMQAARYGHVKVFEFLINKGCNQKAVDTYGANVLHVACKKDNVDKVKYILSKNIADIESKSNYGWTPMLEAARKCNRKVFEFLVNKGCNLKVVTTKGYNVLHILCKFCDVDMVKYIVSRNIVDMESKANFGYTPLLYAAHYGHIKVFEFLLNKGCNQKVVTTYGANVLHVACKKDNVDKVKYILSKIIADIENKDNDGGTPLVHAARYGCRKVFEFLVNRGCNLKVVGRRGNNVLHLACRRGHLDIVKYLITLPAVEGMEKARNEYKRTPIEEAILHGHTPVVNILRHAA